MTARQAGVERTAVPAEPADGSRVRTVRSADGRVDVQCRMPGGSWVRVHSQYGPEAEAAAIVDQALKGGPVPAVVCLVGLGLGYVIDALQERRADIRIVALETIPELVPLLQGRRDWSEAIQSGRLVLGSAPTYALPMPAWPAAILDHEPLTIVHPVLARLEPFAVPLARKALAQFVFEQRANAEARQRLAGLYLRHTIENLPAVVSSPDVSVLDGIAAGTAVVLCGAGPSLDRLIPSLRAHRDRAWLVALDTALRPLLQAGVVPDLVIAVDPTPLNGRHLINLPSRSVPWLVAEASVDPRALTRFTGRTIVCRIGHAEPWPWLEQAGVEPTRLRVWGSVLTAACDLVSRMKGGPVIFAGMDLAFTGGQPYCRGTTFEEDWEGQRVRDALPSIDAVWRARVGSSAIEELDVHGRTTATTPQMVAFRNWVRAAAAAAPAGSFVNVSGNGILHGPGIVQAELGDVLGARRPVESPAARIRTAATPGFAHAVPRLRAAIAAATEACAPATSPWQAWAEFVPGFDGPATLARLAHVPARLGTAQGVSMTTTADQDVWVEVPFDPSTFAGRSPLRWAVREENVLTYAYRLQGKTMTLAFKIVNSTLEGLPANELYLRIPDHYLPQRSIANAIWLGGLAGKECGYATVHPGLDRVVLFRGSEERYPVDPGGFCLFGQLTFEVQ